MTLWWIFFSTIYSWCFTFKTYILHFVTMVSKARRPSVLQLITRMHHYTLYILHSCPCIDKGCSGYNRYFLALCNLLKCGILQVSIFRTLNISFKSVFSTNLTKQCNTSMNMHYIVVFFLILSCFSEACNIDIS